MSASTTPAFSFSKRFLEPVSKCLEVPPELVKLAQRRVEEQGDIRHGALGEVSWRALRRVLAVKQRDAESVKEQEQAYLSDESVNVFMKMVCVKMNSEHYSEAVTESASIDLTDHHIRYITLHSAAWTSLYNRLLGANKIDEAEYRKQAWRMLQRQGINSEKFDDVRLLDAIFLPWCNRAHWTLGIIFPSKRRFALLNSLSTGEKTADAEKRRRMFVTFVKRIWSSSRKGASTLKQKVGRRPRIRSQASRRMDRTVGRLCA